MDCTSLLQRRTALPGSLQSRLFGRLRALEPLSIAAAIGGLLGVSSKLCEYLHVYFAAAKDAPRVLVALSIEIRDTQLALASLQILLTSVASLPTQRTTLIQFEDLAITITDTVLTYSELDATITPFITTDRHDISLRARLGWIQAEKDCVKALEPLQRQKSSLALMLSIVQCTSDIEAHRAQIALAAKVDQILQLNQFLFQRFMNPEQRLEVGSILSRRLEDGRSILGDDNETIGASRISTYNPAIMEDATVVRFTFDEDLKMSRVYRTLQKDTYDHSTISSAFRTTSWSIFSGLTLDSLTPSIISVFSLPLYPDDFHNSKSYRFGRNSALQPLGPPNNRSVNHAPFDHSASLSMGNSGHSATCEYRFVQPARRLPDELPLGHDNSVTSQAQEAANRNFANKLQGPKRSNNSMHHLHLHLQSMEKISDIVEPSTTAKSQLLSASDQPQSARCSPTLINIIYMDTPVIHHGNWPLINNIPDTQFQRSQTSAQRAALTSNVLEPSKTQVRPGDKSIELSSSAEHVLEAATTESLNPSQRASQYEQRADARLPSPPIHVQRSDHSSDSPSYPESIIGVDSDQDDVICRGCGDILLAGKAFELTDDRWHIDCFRCNTCDTRLDSDSEFLLLKNGSLICANCGKCNHCGEDIEDRGVVAGEQVFCANCFRCRNCKRGIENLRYARTSQDIFCMLCHEIVMARRRKKKRRPAVDVQHLESEEGSSRKYDNENRDTRDKQLGEPREHSGQ